MEQEREREKKKQKKKSTYRDTDGTYKLIYK